MFVSDNKVSSIVALYNQKLTAVYDLREIQSILNIVFEHLFGWNKVEFKMNLNSGLSESELLKLNSVLKRLLNNEPIQYVVGKTEFYGLKFNVNSSVLIPRPETEELVHLIIEKHKTQPLRILEIGSGSGCIPISLKKHMPFSEIVSIDVSEQAIDIAKENAHLNEVEVEFKTLDVFSKNVSELGLFHVIVSNPPYIDESERKLMHKNVLDFEPLNALFVTNDILEFYKRTLDLALEFKSKKVYFELNEHYKEDYERLLESYNVTHQFHFDMNTKLRMLEVEFIDV